MNKKLVYQVGNNKKLYVCVYIPLLQKFVIENGVAI
jgi:hypothetical protein